MEEPASAPELLLDDCEGRSAPEGPTQLGPRVPLSEWDRPTRTVFQLRLGEHYYLANSTSHYLDGLYASVAEAEAAAETWFDTIEQQLGGHNYSVTIVRREPIYAAGGEEEKLVWASMVVATPYPYPVELETELGAVWGVFYRYPTGQIIREDYLDGSPKMYASGTEAWLSAQASRDLACEWVLVHDAFVARARENSLLPADAQLWPAYRAEVVHQRTQP